MTRHGLRAWLAMVVLAIGVMVGAPLGAAEATRLTLVLDWFVNPDHAPVLIAETQGFFKEAGLELEIIAPADPNDPPKLVAAGKAELALTYQPQLHIQASKGLPLVRIGTVVATPLTTLVVLRDGPIKSIADLKGKRIGYSVGGFEEALLTAMLGKHGLTMKDVTLIDIIAVRQSGPDRQNSERPGQKKNRSKADPVEDAAFWKRLARHHYQ